MVTTRITGWKPFMIVAITCISCLPLAAISCKGNRKPRGLQKYFTGLAMERICQNELTIDRYTHITCGMVVEPINN